LIIDEKRKLKDLKLKEKSSLRPLQQDEIREFQRKTKQLRKLGTNLEDKRRCIEHVVELITATNDEIVIYMNLKNLSEDYAHLKIVLGSISREDLKRLLSEKSQKK